MLCCPHCSRLSTTSYNIVESELGVIILFNVLDNHKLHNIVATSTDNCLLNMQQIFRKVRVAGLNKAILRAVVNSYFKTLQQYRKKYKLTSACRYHEEYISVLRDYVHTS